MNKTFIRIFEIFFVLIALTAYIGVFTRLFVTRIGATTTVSENYIYGQILFAASYLVALVFFIARPRQLLTIIIQNKIAWSLVLLAIISISWSSAPDITFRRSVALAGTTLFASYLAMRFSTQKTFYMIGFAFAIAAIASYMISIASNEGTVWTGVHLTKNELTRTALLSLLISSYLYNTTQQKRWFFLAIGSLNLVFFSNSATGIIVVLLFLVLFTIFTITRRYSTEKKTLIFVIFGLVIILVTTAISLNLEQVLALIQKDSSISGRLPLWNLSAQVILEKPLLGHGYGGFWTGWNGPAAQIWSQIIWLPPHAHNGFLDIALDIGIPASLIYIFFLFAMLRFAFQNRQLPYSFRLFTILFVIFMFVYNMAENIALSRNSIVWVLSVTVFLQYKIKKIVSSQKLEVEQNDKSE